MSRPVFFNRPSGNVSEFFDSVNYTNDCLHQLKNNNGFQCYDYLFIYETKVGRTLNQLTAEINYSNFEKCHKKG